jgi:DNA-directed RNA polymerase II subunit RPB2
MLYVHHVGNDKYTYVAEILSVSEDVSKPVRRLSLGICAPTGRFTNGNIVVNIPNVRKPVPLFIVFRALGIMSDRDIIQTCLLDMEKYEDLIDHFAPSVHEAGGIMTQLAALQYIAVLTKAKTMIRVHEILANYLLPHVGETNYIEKAYFLGHMVFQLVKVWAGKQAPTNRDNFKFKRIETAGVLISQLFREYLNIQNAKVRLGFDRLLNGNKPLYENNLQQLIRDHYVQIFAENRDVDAGFRRAFKGDWGSAAHTKRIGVVQVLDRLSYFSAMNHLRKNVLYLDSGVKFVGPRLLHASQWGYFDPIDSPDGANIGLYKHLTVSAYITKGMSREPLVQWLYENLKIRFHRLTDCEIVGSSQTQWYTAATGDTVFTPRRYPG